MPRKKMWTEKLNDDKGLPRVEEMTEKMSRKWRACVFPNSFSDCVRFGSRPPATSCSVERTRPPR